MFMFRSKRTTLAKRLWKARVRREHETSCEAQELITNETSLLLKQLTENQLEMLIAAIESRGADLSACVLLPREREPQLRCCQVWRWPDLLQSTELKRLPVCRSAKDPIYICCNPYHWSRLCKPESPPPPYCRFAKERLKPEDRAPSEAGEGRLQPRPAARSLPSPCSLTTNGEDVGGNEWCKLAYWEMATRVGRLFAVELPQMNVFEDLPQGDGLCLATLSHRRTPPHDAVRRTRIKIGLGLTLSQECDGVWAYNRSDNPIFVNSPTLDDPDSRTLLVYRVPPGHCLNIFDSERIPPPEHWDISRTGPVDPNSVRISFAKGWGPKYSRQEVTSCPCWIEVLLAPCR